MTSFELKAYYHGMLGLRAYISNGGSSWRRIGLAPTNPALALAGRGWYLAELLLSTVLPAGTKRLKIEFVNRQTELSQTSIEYR